MDFSGFTKECGRCYALAWLEYESKIHSEPNLDCSWPFEQPYPRICTGLLFLLSLSIYASNSSQKILPLLASLDYALYLPVEHPIVTVSPSPVVFLAYLQTLELLPF